MKTNKKTKKKQVLGNNLKYFRFSKITEETYKYKIEYSNTTIKLSGFPGVISELCNLYLSNLHDSDEYNFQGLDTSEVTDQEAHTVRSVVCLIEYSRSLENMIKKISEEAVTTTSKIKKLHINTCNELNSLKFYSDYKEQRNIK